jgi:hypothetical protein
VDHVSVAKAAVNGDDSGDSFECEGEDFYCEQLGLFGSCLHIGLVDMDDICTGCDMVNRPAIVSLTCLLVFARRNSTSSTSRGARQMIGP